MKNVKNRVFRLPFNTVTVQRLDIQNEYLRVYLYCQREVEEPLFDVKMGIIDILRLLNIEELLRKDGKINI